MGSPTALVSAACPDRDCNALIYFEVDWLLMLSEVGDLPRGIGRGETGVRRSMPVTRPCPGCRKELRLEALLTFRATVES